MYQMSYGFGAALMNKSQAMDKTVSLFKKYCLCQITRAEFDIELKKTIEGVKK